MCAPGVFCVRCPGPLGSCSPMCTPGLLRPLCGVPGHLASVHQCVRSACCVACMVSWPTWSLFSRVYARCVAQCVRCPRPLGSCSPVCPLGVLCGVGGVLGQMAPGHRCVRLACCVAWAVSWVKWLLFIGVHAWRVVLRLWCPGPNGSSSPVCKPGVLCCVCGVLGHLAPAHRCVRSVCCAVRAVFWDSWLLLTGVYAWCVVLRMRCLGPLGCCSAVCTLAVLCCVCGVLSHLSPVHRFARSPCCVACAVSSATWLLFTGVPAPCFVLCAWSPGSLGSCSRLCTRGVLGCLCGVLGHLAPGHQYVRWACCVAFAVTWAACHLFNGVYARCVVLSVRCPGPYGSCLGARFDINIKVEYPKHKRFVFLPSAIFVQFWFLLVFENLHLFTLSTGDRLRTL